MIELILNREQTPENNQQTSKIIFKKSKTTKRSLTKPLIFTTGATFILMTFYEIIKELTFKNLTLWESHSITIVFTTLIAPISAYFAFRKIEYLRQEGIKEINERKKIEKELKHAKAQLELRVEERTSQLTQINNQLTNEVIYRKTAETEIKKSEERYKLLFEMMPSMVFHYNNEMIITDINHTMNDYFNDYGDLVGFNLYEIYDKKILPTLEMALLGKEGIYEGEFYSTLKNELNYISLKVVPYLKSQGFISGGIAVIDIITDRVQGEQKLIEAKEYAEKSDKLKTEFLAQMSHEIRTPLNTILNFTSLIKEDIKDNLNDDLEMSFNVIGSAGNRMIRTIDLILNMSEIQTGLYEYNPKIFNLNKIIENIYNELKQAAKLKQLNFTLNNFVENSSIIADEYSVTQIFDNLINNAIKYTEKGEVSISLYCDALQRLNIDIIDTGIGMTKEYLENLFKPFTQEETGYTRKYEGNGLGLALVKKYCDMNQIKIEVESEKGKGTNFKLIFKR